MACLRQTKECCPCARATNEHTIDDIFQFADEIQQTTVKDDDVLVSYDVTALFTNIPVDGTIQILADKAFTNDWFNKTHGPQLKKEQLIELLEVAVKDQLFQFDGELYEQIDGVALGSPLGPLLANTFMCSLEEKLQEDGQMPSYYKRYVDDTLRSCLASKQQPPFLMFSISSTPP